MTTATDSGARWRDKRRSEVRRLADQDLSARQIAQQLGVGKDTVRRDLEWLSQQAKANNAPPGAPRATDDAPADVGGASDDGHWLKVELDGQLCADLATMGCAGMTPGEAVAHAVSIVAGAYRNAWARGVVPSNVEPRITACEISPVRGVGR